MDRRDIDGHQADCYHDTSFEHEKEVLKFPQSTCVMTRRSWWQTSRQYCTLREISGSLGDLGTFLPLVTALAVNQVNGSAQLPLGPVLLLAGIYTLFVACLYEIPIPVQPMKTIASVSLLGNYPREQILASGIIIALVMLFLGLSGLIKTLQRVTPLAIVRGIQLGLGLALMMKGSKSAYAIDAAGVVCWVGLDSVLVSVLLVCFCLIFMNHYHHSESSVTKNVRVPTALIVFVYGIFVALLRHYRSSNSTQSLVLGSFGFSEDVPLWPSLTDVRVATLELVVPQLPLTLLNSVLALEKLSSDLFPGKGASVQRTSLSLAFGNGCLCWFGMLPMCHGAGGLASQYAFGARSNVSMIFLGLMKITVALVFGTSSVVLLTRDTFPQSVLGVMLLFSGLNLAQVALKRDGDHQTKQDEAVMLITAALSLVINTGIGFLGGTLVAIVFHFFP